MKEHFGKELNLVCKLMTSSNINLIAFGTFGNPNGFRQTFFVGRKELAKSVKSFDLNTNAIKLFLNTKVYAIRKDYASGFNTIAYSVYSFAKEQNSDRSGTFIGSSILFANKIAPEHITISQLNEFHKKLIYNNVQNDIILVNHSDKLSVVKPKNFDEIEFHLHEIENVTFTQNTDRELVVFCNTNDDYLCNFYKNAVDLLNIYDTIYFTDSSEVAEFVHQKGIFKLIQNVGDKNDFEMEIKNLIEERKRKREQSILDFEKEFQKINDDKYKTIQKFKRQIEQNERTHFENEKKLNASKNDINKIAQFYDDFLNTTKELINQLRHNNSKLEDVKQIHNNNKTLFNAGISDFNNPIYVTTITSPKPNGGLSVEHHNQGDENFDEGDDKIDKTELYKVSTKILSILLIFTLLYFSFLNSSNNPKVKKVITTQKEQTQVPSKKLVLEDLNPKSNSELNEKDNRNIAKKITYNSKIDDVVRIIFDGNPKDIKSSYLGQEDNYSKHLFERNKNCFENRGGVLYFIKDSLIHIPSYHTKEEYENQ